MTIVRWLALASLAALCACGGGGSSSDDKSWLTFTPTPIDVTTYAGDEYRIEVVARSSKTISERLNLAVISAAPVVRPAIEIAAISSTEYRARLDLSTNLPPGTYTGNFEVRLCRDDPVVCANPYPGSPWQLPYRFTIRPNTNLKPLQPLSGSAEWTTFQGNPGRTGYVAANVNPADFTMRFKWFPAEKLIQPQSLVTSGDMLIFSNREPGSPGHTLRALSGLSGQVAWRGEWRNNEGSLAAINGHTYVASTELEAFGASSGNRLWKMRHAWGFSLAPTIVAHRSKLYVGAEEGFEGSVARYDATSGALEWTSPRLGAPTRPSAIAVDDARVYQNNGKKLSIVRDDDGSLVSTVAYPREISGDQLAVVLDGKGSAFVAGYGELRGLRGLARVNLSSNSIAWVVSDRFTSHPVYANGVLYVANESRLEARSPETGALLWSWQAPGHQLMSLLVVGNHAFVRSSGVTFAVDLTTRNVVWSYPLGGEMAVSANGVLYIANMLAVVAFNLH
jgi:outer membrane protein assembly factor BamB